MLSRVLSSRVMFSPVRLRDSVYVPSLCLSVTRNHYFAAGNGNFGSASALVAVIKHWHYPASRGRSCLPSLDYEVVKAVIQESN